MIHCPDLMLPTKSKDGYVIDEEEKPIVFFKNLISRFILIIEISDIQQKMILFLI